MKNNMKIPEQITVAGLTFDVKFVDPDEIDENLGLCESDRGLIKLNNSKKWKKEIMEQVFIHEIMHLIFNSLYIRAGDEITVDEKLIDNISLLLHQIILQLN